jgi:hypothetical protein
VAGPSMNALPSRRNMAHTLRWIEGFAKDLEEVILPKESSLL